MNHVQSRDEPLTLNATSQDNLMYKTNEGNKSNDFKMVWDKFVELNGYIYKIFDGCHEKSLVSNMLATFFAAAILISLFGSFLETVPSFMEKQTTCLHPVCDNDPNICPGSIVCAPVPPPILETLNAACIFIFTIEYGVRFFTVWSVSSGMAGIVPRSRRGSIPVYPLWEHYFRFVTTFKNMIDVGTFLPFYLTSKGAPFLRTFRMLRIVMFLQKYEEANELMSVVILTCVKSLPALGVLIMFILLGMVFFGALIFQMEGGTFRVTADYPDGEYLRASVNGVGIEVSPFLSIPTSMYWVVTTITTVGYGDLAPTSWTGRTLANIIMLVGVVVLALPIAVIGSNFHELYHEALQAKWNAASDALQLNGMSEEDMFALFHKLDSDGGGTLDKAELRAAFQDAGVKVGAVLLDQMFRDVDMDGDGFIVAEEFVRLCIRLQKPELHGDTAAHTNTVDQTKADVTHTKVAKPGTLQGLEDDDAAQFHTLQSLGRQSLPAAETRRDREIVSSAPRSQSTTPSIVYFDPAENEEAAAAGQAHLADMADMYLTSTPSDHSSDISGGSHIELHTLQRLRPMGGGSHSLGAECKQDLIPPPSPQFALLKESAKLRLLKVREKFDRERIQIQTRLESKLRAAFQKMNDKIDDVLFEVLNETKELMRKRETAVANGSVDSGLDGSGAALTLRELGNIPGGSLDGRFEVPR